VLVAVIDEPLLCTQLSIKFGVKTSHVRNILWTVMAVVNPLHGDNLCGFKAPNVVVFNLFV
jgi:hypothetical protein